MGAIISTTLQKECVLIIETIGIVRGCGVGRGCVCVGEWKGAALKLMRREIARVRVVVIGVVQ